MSTVDEHGRAEADASRRDYIRRLVDAAPPLTSEQRAKLAAIFAADRPVGGDAA